MTALGVIAFSYLQGQQKYGDAARLADVGDLSTTLPSSLDAAEVDNYVKVDWEALLAANPDTVAWLYIPNTAINYPVVQGPDNIHYLTYDFDGDAGWLANYGAIFMDYRNDPTWHDQLYFIYGHHMNDGSMFSDVSGMSNPERFEKCRDVYLLSPHGNFHLRTFAIVHISPEEEVVLSNFGDEDQQRAYLYDKIERSAVKATDLPDVSAMGQVFAFATCDSESWGRDLLYAYVVDTSVSGLSGTVGIDSAEDGQNGFVEELEVNETSG